MPSSQNPAEVPSANGVAQDPWQRYNEHRNGEHNQSQAEQPTRENAQRAAPDGRTIVLETLVAQLATMSLEQSRMFTNLFGGTMTSAPPVYATTPMTMHQAFNAGTAAGTGASTTLITS